MQHKTQNVKDKRKTKKGNEMKPTSKKTLATVQWLSGKEKFSQLAIGTEKEASLSI